MIEAANRDLACTIRGLIFLFALDLFAYSTFDFCSKVHKFPLNR